MSFICRPGTSAGKFEQTLETRKFVRPGPVQSVLIQPFGPGKTLKERGKLKSLGISNDQETKFQVQAIVEIAGRPRDISDENIDRPTDRKQRKTHTNFLVMIAISPWTRFMGNQLQMLFMTIK